MPKEPTPEELLEFPCQYQFKAIGAAGTAFKDAIVQVVDKHAALSQDAIHVRPSGKGSYQSISVLVTLHNYLQLTTIYAEMRKVPGLKMLL